MMAISIKMKDGMRADSLIALKIDGTAARINGTAGKIDGIAKKMFANSKVCVPQQSKGPTSLRSSAFVLEKTVVLILGLPFLFIIISLS